VWHSGSRGKACQPPDEEDSCGDQGRDYARQPRGRRGVGEHPEEIQAALTEAIASGGFLTLVDDKGRKVLIPASGIAYIDLGAEHVRAVGFGAI